MNKCPNLSNKKIKAEFDELVSIFGENGAYFIWDKSDGNGLELAPNGADSKLFKDLLEIHSGDRKRALIEKAKVYSDEFITQFGDRVNGKTNLRENVDENGEPLASVITNKGGFDSEWSSILYHLNLKTPRDRCIEIITGALLAHKVGHRVRLALNNNQHNHELTLSLIRGICQKYNVYVEKDKDGYLTFFDYSGDDEIKFNANKDIPVLNVIDFLQERFPQLRCMWVSPERMRLMTGEDANAFVQNGVVYLAQGKVTADIAAEEFLHPFTRAIQTSNAVLFLSLLSEAKKEFPSLAEKIKATYSDKKKFSQEDVDNEIVTQALARHFNKQNKGGKGEKFKELANEVLRWIAYHINKIIDQFGGQGRINPKDLPKMSLKELAALVNANDLTFDVSTNDKRRYNISGEELSKTLAESFATLYQSYMRMPGKSVRREGVENKVYETMTKLRTIHDFNSAIIALDFALESLGIYTVENGQVVLANYDKENPATYNRNILTFLQSEKDRYESESQRFSRLTPDELVNLYKNNIGFYKNLLKQLQQIRKVSAEIRYKITQLEESVNAAEKLWKEGMVAVTDRIVDKYVDEQGPADEAERQALKVNYKDALHENILFGDLKRWQTVLQNAGQSDSPIVRIGFHIIQEANLKTQLESHKKAIQLTKAYQKVPRRIRSLNTAWLTVFMEFDRNGIPTGNFARPINYGQYEQDLNNFVQQLNEEFDDTYGHHYIKDGDSYINSATKARADEEEWGTTGSDRADMPTFVKYQLEIEKWKCDHCNRRYTYNYYKERLSRPYKYQEDKTIEFGDDVPHGLSPKTLARYDYYQSNINYYLNKCVDKETGYARPEKLSKSDRLKLKMWQDELKEFSNPFLPTGQRKTGDEFNMAMEVLRWQQFIGEKTRTTVSLEKYRIEYAKALEESIRKGDPTILSDFVECNTRFGVNPNYTSEKIGHIHKQKQDFSGAILALILKRAVESITRREGSFDKNLHMFLNNETFWNECREIDEDLEEYKKSDPDFAEAYKAAFKTIPQFYVDPSGNYRDLLGRVVTPADIQAAEDAGRPRTDLMTYHSFIIKHYVARAKAEGSIPYFVDEGGNPYDFTIMTDKEIEDVVSRFFSYKHLVQDKDTGSFEVKYYPLSIFNKSIPSAESFRNPKTGGMEPTVLDVPFGRFATKEDSESDPALMYLNKHYDFTQQESEQPIELYYKNHDFDKIHEMGKEVEDLYNLLVLTTKDMFSLYDSENRLFNYKLPLINAENFAMFSRMFPGNGVRISRTKAFENLYESVTGIQENDSEMRSQDQWLQNPDGSRTLDVPRRFYRPLDDPSTITTDITGAVKLLVRAANNYNNSKKVQGALESLMYAMDDNNRDISSTSNVKEGASKNQLEAFKHMLEINLYDNKFNIDDKASKLEMSMFKFVRSLLRFSSLQLLALNLLSMEVGFRDQLKTILVDALVDKYLGVRDFLYGLIMCTLHLPLIIANLGNPLPNNKITALMTKFGVSKDYRRTHEGQNRSRLRKISSQLLMGGFSALDYFGSSILMVGMLNNSKLFKGLTDDLGNVVIPKGFYNEYELKEAFIRAGYVPSDAEKQVSRARRFGSTSLYDAFKFKDGDVEVRPEYADLVTQKTMQHQYGALFLRAALAAGVTPDNDVPYWKTTLIGAWIGAMRGWMFNWIQAYINGRDEITGRQIKEEDKETVKHGVTTRKKKLIKKGKTAEDYARGYAWNFETGKPMDRIIPSLCEAFMAKLKSIKNVFIRGKHVESMNYAQRKALKTVIMNTIVTAALGFYANIMIHLARTVPQPPSYTQDARKANVEGYTTSYEEARYESSMWFPWERKFWQYDLWKLREADLAYRTFESSVSIIDIGTATDMIKSITALQNGVEEIVGAPVGIGEYMLDIGDDEIIKSGSSPYKNYKKKEVKGLFKAIGPLDNLHTSQSYWGLRSNLLFYMTRTDAGKIMKFFGGETKLTPEKPEKLKKGTHINDADLPDIDVNLPDVGVDLPDF